MAPSPTSPAGFPGWGALTPHEARVWGYLLMPGKRCLAKFAKADRTSKQSPQNAKRKGEDKFCAAAIANVPR